MDSCALLKMSRSPNSLTRSTYPLSPRSPLALRMSSESITLKEPEAPTGLFAPSRRYPFAGFSPSLFESDEDEYEDEGLLFVVNNKLSDSDDEEEAALKGVAFTDAQMMKSIYQQLKAKRNKSDGEMLSRPAKDAKEDAEALYLRIDMPGLAKEDVKVRFAKGILCIKGQNGEEENKYSEHVSVSSEVFKVREMKAEMKNGVLKVVVPKIKVEEREDYIMVNVD